MAFIHRKSVIKRCEELGNLYIKQGIEFKTLALSLEQNKVTLDIKEFVEKRYKLFIEVLK